MLGVPNKSWHFCFSWPSLSLLLAESHSQFQFSYPSHCSDQSVFLSYVIHELPNIPHFNAENGGTIFLQNIGNNHKTTQCNSAADCSLKSCGRENLESYEYISRLWSPKVCFYTRSWSDWSIKLFFFTFSINNWWYDFISSNLNLDSTLYVLVITLKESKFWRMFQRETRASHVSYKLLLIVHYSEKESGYQTHQKCFKFHEDLVQRATFITFYTRKLLGRQCTFPTNYITCKKVLRGSYLKVWFEFLFQQKINWNMTEQEKSLQ